jgi:hypothetical protein
MMFSGVFRAAAPWGAPCNLLKYLKTAKESLGQARREASMEIHFLSIACVLNGK